ncbi:MAG: CopG family transcriptional regulator [Gaiellaceae bacterium]
MKPTQIHLGEEEVSLLDAEARATGASRSELIRRAIREAYAKEQPRRRPRTIGIMASGRINAANDEEWLRAEFDRLWPRRKDPAA